MLLKKKKEQVYPTHPLTDGQKIARPLLCNHYSKNWIRQESMGAKWGDGRESGQDIYMLTSCKGGETRQKLNINLH